MNIFQKQAIRRPYLTVLLVLLLFTSIALSGVSYSGWMVTRAQRDSVDKTYTTVAVLKPEVLQGDYSTILRLAEQAPQVRQLDRRVRLSAHIPGSTAWSTLEAGWEHYNAWQDSEAYALSAYAAQCTDLEWTDNAGYYRAEFQVQEVLSLAQTYQNFKTPEVFSFFSKFYNPDGSIPFQEGKNYLLWGMTALGTTPLTFEPHCYAHFYQESTSDFNTGELRAAQREDGSWYNFSHEGTLPWFTEYSGSPEAFLDNDAGRVWKEEILPLCQRSQESASLVLTDRLESLYSFQTGDAYLIDGRFFTPEEYESGADVCMVSGEYALCNGWELGDQIPMELYLGHCLHTEVSQEGWAYHPQRVCLQDANALDISKTYTIVGLYSRSSQENGPYDFRPDTVFAPKASLPNATRYEAPSDALRNSIVLRNGTTGDFGLYMASQGFPGEMFDYYDQDFSAMEESLSSLEGNALRLLLIGMLMLGVAGALFLYLNFRAINPIIRSVRLLGLPGKRVFREVLVVLLTQVVLAVVLGCLAAALLYDTMTEVLFSAAIALDLGAVVTIGTVSLGLLVLSTLLCATAAVKKKLM